MNLQRAAAVLVALGLVACSNASGITSKGSVAWSYDNPSAQGGFGLKCVNSTSGQCRVEFFDSSSKSLQVVAVSAGHSTKITLPAGTMYLLIAPNDTLAILAKTNKLQQGQVSGSQEFNKDHA